MEGDDFGERCCVVLTVHLTFPEDENDFHS